MVKVVFCLPRRPGMSLEAFQRHRLEVHAPLVRKCSRALRIQRYVQLHYLDGDMSEKLRAFRGSPDAYDGVAGIWYESLEALRTLGKDPQAREASRELLEDEKRFVGLARSPIWLAEEKEIVSEA